MTRERPRLCGCQLPEGFWSEHGAHWHEHDAAYIEFCIQSKLRPEWGAKCSDEEIQNRLLNTKDEAMRKHLSMLLHQRKDERERLSHYLGQSVFYCACPAWVHAVQENAKRRRASESAQTARQQAGVRLRG